MVATVSCEIQRALSAHGTIKHRLAANKASAPPWAPPRAIRATQLNGLDHLAGTLLPTRGRCQHFELVGVHRNGLLPCLIDSGSGRAARLRTGGRR
jgi:hypothetical protein